jgi:glucosyl-dolichyl phosphate glucuronosyltransferase
MEISVVVCTRDRAQPLRQFLGSVEGLQAPVDLAWEILVVDNGSTDDTPRVVEDFIGRLPIRTIREERPGLSNARNAGVAAARGRYICWTDDDVELDERWLAAYAAAFRRHPQAAIFGGKIVPVLQPPTPRWFSRLAHAWPLTNILAARDFGDHEAPVDLEKGLVPWGANFAVRTEDQRRFAYDPKLGVSPVQRRSGEEAQVIYEMVQSGATGWWIPDAIVRHIYPPHRQTKRYLYEHYYAMGETWAYLERTHRNHHMNKNGAGHQLLSRPVEMLRARSAIDKVLYRAFTMAGLTRRALYALVRAAMCDGAAQFRTRRDFP